MSENTRLAAIGVLALIIVFTGLDIGCYIANVAPLKAGGCILSTGVGSVTVPCPKEVR